jgi:hypothetical protein
VTATRCSELNGQHPHSSPGGYGAARDVSFYITVLYKARIRNQHRHHPPNSLLFTHPTPALVPAFLVVSSATAPTTAPMKSILTCVTPAVKLRDEHALHTSPETASKGRRKDSHCSSTSSKSSCRATGTITIRGRLKRLADCISIGVHLYPTPGMSSTRFRLQHPPNGAFLAPVCADDGWVFGDRWQALKAQNQVGATTAATATWMISEPSSAATREEHLVG